MCWNTQHISANTPCNTRKIALFFSAISSVAALFLFYNIRITVFFIWRVHYEFFSIKNSFYLFSCSLFKVSALYRWLYYSVFIHIGSKIPASRDFLYHQHDYFHVHIKPVYRSPIHRGQQSSAVFNTIPLLPSKRRFFTRCASNSIQRIRSVRIVNHEIINAIIF